MKKGWIYAVLIVAALAAVTSCSKRGDGKQQNEKLAVDGTLTVGIIDGEDEYTSKNGDAFMGIEPEIAARLGTSLELTVAYVQASGQDELLQLLRQGKVDLAMGRLPKLDEEQGDIQASVSYARGGMYLATEKYCYMDNLAALADQSVIMVSKSVSSSIRADIDGLNRMEVQEGDSVSDMAAAIKGKLCMAVICTEREALSMVEENPDAIQVSELLNSPQDYYSAYVLTASPQLLQNLNGVIGSYMDDRVQGNLGTTEEETK